MTAPAKKINALSDERIFELARKHLGGRGHALIWADDARYAAACNMPRHARWSLNSVRAEQTLAFARALLTEAAAGPDGWNDPSTPPTRSGYYDTRRIGLDNQLEGLVRCWWDCERGNWFASPHSCRPMQRQRIWRDTGRNAEGSPR